MQEGNVELFCKDIVPSERDWFKISFSYVTTKYATKSREEEGFVSCIVNVPSRYLAQRREKYVVERIFALLAKYTGFTLEGKTETSIARRSYSIETCYVLKNRKTSEQRSWTGSTRLRGSNERGQRAGVLQPFTPLIHPNQLITALVELSDSTLIADKITDVFAEEDTNWTYTGCISVVFLIQLKGYFPPQFRSRNVTEVIDADQ